MYTSIIATSESLRELMRASFRADVGPSGLASLFSGGVMDVSLATPREMQGQQQGLSMWLYRVMRDDTRLNDPPVQRPLPGFVNGTHASLAEQFPDFIPVQKPGQFRRIRKMPLPPVAGH